MQNELIRQTLKNVLLSTLIFGCLMLLLWLVELLFPSLELLKWSDAAWCVGIPASVVGVAYILTIRDPRNYMGFYPGILMSVLLAVQFFLQGNYDLTLLYIVVFIPFLVLSIINWKKGNEQEGGEENKVFEPEFLSVKQKLVSALVFVAIVAVDYVVVTYAFGDDGQSSSVALNIVGGLMIAASVLANFWLIYRRMDAWVYWVIYSISGMVFYILLSNLFSIVLFLFFLVVNSSAGISWWRLTPKKNMGWLKPFLGCGLLLLLPLLCSCGKPVQPKPYGYFRLNIPDTSYTKYTYRDVCEFMKSDNAVVELREDSNWFNLSYEMLSARIHLSYRPLRGDLRELSDDAHEFVFKHAGKASAINEQGYSNAEKRVYGVLYELEGNIASPYQFYLTDSTKHFLRASVYFETIPNQDSLQPAVDYIQTDVRRMIESFSFLR